MYPIVSITGKAGSGKDTFATLVAQSYGPDKVKIIAFADPLKDLAQRLFGIDELLLFGPSEGRMAELDSNKPEFWEKVHANLNNPLFMVKLQELFNMSDPYAVALPKAALYNVVKNFRNQYEGAFNRLTVRNALQVLGTSWGRAVDPNLWIRYAQNRAANLLQNGADLIIITDTRFRSEVLALKTMGACMVKILSNRNLSLPRSESEHISEISQDQVPSFWFDTTIYNNKTQGMKDLMYQMSIFMDKHIYHAKSNT